MRYRHRSERWRRRRRCGSWAVGVCAMDADLSIAKLDRDAHPVLLGPDYRHPTGLLSDIESGRRRSLSAFAKLARLRITCSARVNLLDCPPVSLSDAPLSVVEPGGWIRVAWT